jgi:outer membrane protein assembly factor BamB
MKLIKLNALLLTALALVPGSGARASEAAAILKTTGHHGGLCLVAGGDGKLASGLAAGSNLYVCLHSAETRAAAVLALKFAGGDLRERLAVRDGKLVTASYGSELFNLIAIKGWGKGDSAGVTLKELERILVPGGSLAISGGDSGLAAQAAKLKLKKLAGASGFVIWRKPRLKGEDWRDSNSRNSRCNPKATIKPCYNLRWRSGLQFNRGHKAIHPVRIVNGRMAYRELHPAPGSQELYSYHLTVRDAFNGRVIWSKPDKSFDTVKANRHFAPGGLDAHGDRVYALLGGKVSCFDAETGRIIYSVKDKDLDVLLARKPHSLRTVRVHQGKYLLIGAPGLSLVCDAASGRKLWQSRLYVARSPIEGDTVYVRSRETYMALSLADGKRLWAVDGSKGDLVAKGQMRQMFCTGQGLHIAKSWQKPYRLDTLDLKTGRKLWTYRAKPIDSSLTPNLKYPVKKGRYKDRMVREAVAYDDEIFLIQKMCLGWNGTHSYVTKLDAKTGKATFENKLPTGDKPTDSQRCYSYRGAGDYLHHGDNKWLNRHTLKYTNYSVIRSSCGYGTYLANRMVYSTAHKKGAPVNGMCALGVENFPGLDYAAKPLNVLKRGGATASAVPTSASDWPMYRANPSRGSSIAKGPGATLVKKWEAPVGRGRLTHGRMTLERTGLTQAVSAWGLVIVSDLEGLRVVALDKNSGKQKWIFPVGSRVEFSPSLYKGLCLFGARDGWVYCLDANTGRLVYKLLAAPAEAYIGGREGIQSLWPAHGVAVIDGVAYTATGVVTNMHGGITLCAFRPETGQLLWKQRVTKTLKSPRRGAGPRADIFVRSPKAGTVLMFHHFVDAATGKLDLRNARRYQQGALTCKEPLDNQLATNHIWWNSEDHSGVVFQEGRRTAGRQIAFNKDLGISFAIKGRGAFRLGPFSLVARNAPKKDVWKTPDMWMNVDGLALTSQYVYAAGHYEKHNKNAELRVLSAKDGKELKRIDLGKVYPGFDGLSLTGDSVFIATRDGKLIRYGPAK